MRVSCECKILMDLVRDHEYMMLPAYIEQPLQLITCPHASGRVVRGTEDEQSDLIFYNLLFEIFKVDGVHAGCIDQI